MKTAEEILKSKLDGKITFVNNPDYTFNKVIEAMEEYRLQSHPSPMSAEQVCRWVKASERLPEIGMVVLVKYFDTYQELYYKNNVWFVKGTNLVAYSECFSLQLEWLETLATTPSVKAEGWVSVEDGLPEIPPPYYDKDNEVHKPIQGEVWCFDGSEVYEDWFYFNSKPVGCTHWKYKEAIPSPPKQK